MKRQIWLRMGQVLPLVFEKEESNQVMMRIINSTSIGTRTTIDKYKSKESSEMVKG